VTPARDRILSQFIDAWNAGTRPEVEAFVERAPEAEREALAEAIASFLTWAPTPDYTAAALDAIAAEPAVEAALAAARGPGGLWPELLPRLRTRARLSVAELAAALVRQLGLPAGSEDKAEGYLRRMEGGGLEPAGVSRRLLGGLGRVLGVPAGELEGAGDVGTWRPPPPAAAARFRAAAGAAESVREDLEVLADVLAAGPDDGWDEVDALFRGGR
jgi:hypothetical protein